MKIEDSIPPTSLPDINVVTSVNEISLEWAQDVGRRLEKASWGTVQVLQSVLPASSAIQLLEAAYTVLKLEPSVLDVNPAAPAATVTVVGDTHGQLHDVLRMLDVAGYPSTSAYYIFNGDFVDRGAWGLEVLVFLAALKVALPDRVILLRGNHESSTCTQLYGFRTEVFRKYGHEGQKVYRMCKQLFSVLPLAAVVSGATLVLHGGLFRRPPSRPARPGAPPSLPKKRKRNAPNRLRPGPPTLGNMEDLRLASKGGVDPNGTGASMLATDVLWSDPVAEPGLCTNDSRGVGLIFGPEITQEFLGANGLRLILRSHEGPDARWGREDLPGMKEGFSIDHVTPAGCLMTVFSAPDYPQFQTDGQERYHNLGAVAVLRGPSWDTPSFVQYEAVHPRPQVEATYEYNDVPGSDEEMELGAVGSDVSIASEGEMGGSEISNGMSEGEGSPDPPSSAGEVVQGEVLHSKAARATQQAMAATAEAVAKLHLQNGSAASQSEAHKDGNPGPSSCDADTAAAQEDAMCGQIGQLLNPADSGYLADTEGQTFVLQPAEGKVESSNGAGVKHVRTRGPATRNSNVTL
ncbi:g355 [Coccomyxa elongata]